MFFETQGFCENTGAQKNWKHKNRKSILILSEASTGIGTDEFKPHKMR